MGVYIGLVCLTIIFGFLYQHKAISKKVACFTIALAAIIVYGLRSSDIGNIDIPRYINHFENIAQMSYSEVITRYSGTDLGFYILTKTVTLLSNSYNVWFLTIGALVIGSLSILIYRYSSNITLSYLIFFAMFCVLTFSLLRHCCALSFVILGYCMFRENRIRKGLICYVIAATMHLSSLIVLPALLLRKVKVGWKNVIIVITAIVLPLAVPDLLSSIIRMVASTRFEAYSSANIRVLNSSTLIIFLLLTIVTVGCYILDKNFGAMMKINAYEINMLSLGLCFYALTGLLAEFTRVAMFFSFIIIIALPNAIYRLRNSKYRFIQRASKLIMIGCNTIMIYRIFVQVLPASDVVPYLFFWQ